MSLAPLRGRSLALGPGSHSAYAACARESRGGIGASPSTALSRKPATERSAVEGYPGPSARTCREAAPNLIFRRDRLLGASALRRIAAAAGGGYIAAMLTRLANPSVFLRWSGAALPFLAAGAAVLLAVGLYYGLVPGARRLPAGRDRPDHVRARSGGLARHRLLRRHGGLGARHARLAPPAGRRLAEGRGPDRRRVHADLPRHRLAVGQADVGHLVGLGRPADLGPGAVPHVLRLHRAVARDRGSGPRRARRRDPDAGRRRSTCRSSSSRSTGGTRCTSRPRVLRSGGPTIHPSMLYAAARHGGRRSRCIAVTLHLAGMRTEILRRRVRTLSLLEAERLDRQAA